MDTVYVDINNGYRKSGSGTSDSPMNWFEFLNHLRTNSTHLYLLMGHRRLEHSGPTIIHLDSLGTGSSLDSADIVSPWVITLGAYSTLKTGMNAHPVNFKNGIIHQKAGSGKIEFCWQVELPVNLFNMYLISEGSTNHNRLEGSPLKVYGCSIISTSPYGSWHFGVEGSGRSFFRDSIISIGHLSNLELGGAIFFQNCVFSNPKEKRFSGGTADFKVCQYGWSPAAPFPTGASPKEEFSVSRIAPLGTDNAITIPSTGSFIGYDQGLFGGEIRKIQNGIGSFYFDNTEIEVLNPEVDVVYTVSSVPVKSIGFFDVGDDEEDPNHRYMAYIDEENNLCLKETTISTMTLKADLGFIGLDHPTLGT